MAAEHSTTKGCAVCGGPVPTSIHDRIYCSTYCYKRADYIRSRQPVRRATCVQCSGPIPSAVKGDRADRMYCSSRCKGKALYARNRQNIRCRMRERYHARPKPPRPPRTPPKPITCSACGVVFHAYRRTMCLACWWAQFRATPVRRSYVRARNHKRDAIKRGASSAEVVYPVVVFARDRWHCQLCGVATPKKLKGKRAWASPTVDHIVPLTHGGAHSYQNVQCACWRCNQRKGAKTKGQFRMF